MKLTACRRCNQPRNPADLELGRCRVCRRHKCPKHEAGDSTCYSHCKCRCDLCLSAGRARAKYTGHLRKVGSPVIRGAEAARERIAILRASGMGTAEIETRSSVHRVTILAVERGTLTRLHRNTLGALLAVRPVPISEQTTGRVPIAGTRRRIHALMAIGWSTKRIAAEAGITYSQVGLLSIADVTFCHADTRRKIAAAYERLWDQEPTGVAPYGPSRVRNLAKANGWAPPAAWDEGFGPNGIDNPKAKPSLADGPLRRRGETALEVRRMIGTDTAEGIARRLSFANVDSLVDTLKRSNPDLAKQLSKTRTEAA